VPEQVARALPAAVTRAAAGSRGESPRSGSRGRAAGTSTAQITAATDRGRREEQGARATRAASGLELRGDRAKRSTGRRGGWRGETHAITNNGPPRRGGTRGCRSRRFHEPAHAGTRRSSRDDRAAQSRQKWSRSREIGHRRLRERVLETHAALGKPLGPRGADYGVEQLEHAQIAPGATHRGHRMLARCQGRRVPGLPWGRSRRGHQPGMTAPTSISIRTGPEVGADWNSEAEADGKRGR